MRGLVICIFMVLLYSSCAVNPVTGKRELMLMTESQEISMGVSYDPQIIRMYGSYNDPELLKFIEEKGKKMGAISHRPNLEYQFRLLDSPVVNAFAVPGGFVYFTRGIMAHFNNEAEFAGVLGHEIGHITARHSVRQQSQAMLAQLALLGGMMASEEFMKYADIANAGLSLLFLKYSRENESESDKLGVEYSTEIGYNSTEMAYFFNTLKRLSGGAGGALPEFLSTHPDPEDRLNNIKNLTKSLHLKKNLDPSLLKVNRDAYLRRIDGLVYGDDPRQGFVENSVFYHPEMKFKFNIPQGWQTVNSPSQVQTAPKDNKAVMLLTLEEGTSLDDAEREVIRRNKLRLIESNITRVNKIPAKAIIAELEPQQNAQDQSQELRVMIYLIQYNNTIFNMTGIASKAEFNNYAGAFTASMRSFSELTDPTKLSKQPERIKIITVANDSTLKEVLRRDGIPEDRINELSILNGMMPDDPVKAGMLIKSVR